MQTRSLDADAPEQRVTIRRLIGETALAGLHSRALVPGLHRGLREVGEQMLGDHLFLLVRLRRWAEREGVPFAHPVLEYLAQGYPRNSLEFDLLSDGVCDILDAIATAAEPWEPTIWLERGW